MPTGHDLDSARPSYSGDMRCETTARRDRSRRNRTGRRDGRRNGSEPCKANQTHGTGEAVAPYKSTALARYKNGQTFGRPNLFKPEYCELVVELARERGLSVLAFAGFIGVTEDTVYEWRKVYGDFSEACARAKMARTLFWENSLATSRKGAQTTASVFALKNVAPNEWRDVRHTEHAHKVSADMLSDAQLREIIARKYPGNASEGDVIDAEFEHVSEPNATR